jgi:hypothetical protein
MFISAKYEEVKPLLINTIVNNIGHGKFKKEVIENKEIEILKLLGFKVGETTIIDFIDIYLQLFGEDLKSNIEFMKRVVFMSKLTCFNYDLMQNNPKLNSLGVIYASINLGIKHG